ncbi:FAD-dependent oxidoreductase, partial [Candidatus Woesearchaeota archaeon]|nr:FAD-dependent oxidoreductase [Candidatus Woesearchaeota archaeon]
ILLPYNIRGEIGSVQRKSRLSTIAAKAGIEYIPAKEAHIGSDKLPALMKRIVADIQKNATIVTEQEVTGFDDGIIAGDNVYKADHYILATGRAGSGTLEKIIEQLNLTHSYNPVDIGVRVEVPKEIMEEVCAVSWDFKARMRTSTYEDEVRTFCVCPQGFVSREDHNGFCMVNGHSLSKQGAQSDNTNFAFLVTYRLTEPLKDGDLFGKEIARKATFIGDGKPILQRLGDLRRGRRSTWERINKFHRPVPTLTDVNPGDIGSAMEYRFVLDVIEGLEKLDEMVKGVANDSTLLYCPEIKFHGKRFTTDEYLETNKKGVYVAGDGSGWSRGIVGAACCGLLAAEGIMRKQ